MDIRVLYVVLALIAIGGGYILYLKWHNQSIFKKEILEFKTRYSGAPLREYQKRALGYGAILSCSRNESILSLIPTERMDSHRLGLQKQWQITDHTTAVEILNNLLKQHRSKEFDHFISTHADNKELRSIYQSIATQLNLPNEFVDAIISTYAWDVGRMINLSKWCFWLSYITEEELYTYFQEANLLASQEGKDWAEYTCSFLLGRCIQGFKLEEVIEAAQQLLNPSEEWKQKMPNINIYQEIPFK